MTAREDVLARIDRAAPELRAHAVKELWLFGSAAREELKAGSDIDILVDFNAPVTLFDARGLVRPRSATLGTVCWPNNADLDSDVLYAKVAGRSPSGVRSGDNDTLTARNREPFQSRST